MILVDVKPVLVLLDNQPTNQPTNQPRKDTTPMTQNPTINPKIKFAKGHPSTIIPSKDLTNAGYDIYPNFDAQHITIEPHETVMIPTRLYSIIPDGYYMQLFERGSTGTKGIAQRAGVIDPSYRGEWMIPITNTTEKPIYIAKNDSKFLLDMTGDKGVIKVLQKLTMESVIIYPYGKAICQAILLPIPNSKVEEISLYELKLNKTNRGDGKLGSSNK